MAKKNKKSKKSKKNKKSQKHRYDDEIYENLLHIEVLRMTLTAKLMILEKDLGYDPEQITKIVQKEMLDALMSGKGGK